MYKHTSKTVFSKTPIGAMASRSEVIEEIRTMSSEFNAFWHASNSVNPEVDLMTTFIAPSVGTVRGLYDEDICTFVAQKSRKRVVSDHSTASDLVVKMREIEVTTH